MEILIVGSGNIAWHFAKMLSAQAFRVAISGRNKPKVNALAKTFQLKIVEPEEVFENQFDVILVAVSDAAIQDVVSGFGNTKSLVVHCSGATAMDALSPVKRRGVIYPLQTFTKGVDMAYSEIPFSIEASYDDDTALLKELVTKISNTVHVLSSEQRLKLHLAGVVACNFSNLMYTLADEVCQENKIDFKLLYPLIAQTSEKIKRLQPLNAQTGPAVRNDKQTMQKHTALLDNKPELKELYESLSALIQKKTTSSQK